MTQRDSLDKLNQLRSIQGELRDVSPSQEKIQLMDAVRMTTDLLLSEAGLSEVATRELISKMRNQLNLLQKIDEQDSNQDALRTT